VQKDHPFLDPDSLQSLFRRLHALNRCAKMKVDNMPKNSVSTSRCVVVPACVQYVLCPSGTDACLGKTLLLKRKFAQPAISEVPRLIYNTLTRAHERPSSWTTRVKSVPRILFILRIILDYHTLRVMVSGVAFSVHVFQLNFCVNFSSFLSCPTVL
jgi:hypothetical protein